MTDVREAVIEVLKGLDETEQRLLNAVLRLEHEKLYQKQPRLTNDLVRIVQETVK